MDRGGVYSLLTHPRIYQLKTRLLSFGRAGVRDYLAQHHLMPAHALLLDVGCGTGGRGAQLSGRYHGVDHNPSYIAYATRHHPGHFAVMDATALALVDGHFDFTLAVALCHHLPDDEVRAAATEMLRVTRPGGRAVIVDGILAPWSNPLGRLIFAADRGRHTRSLAELTALLLPLGYACTCPDIPRSYPYERAVFVAQR